ncbi:MAG: hypothetical protein L6R39_006609 [Caloplaca ligustica]|nr:MAG: hypothetical protein L6R39_006609 [Caloplaca ligustica]
MVAESSASQAILRTNGGLPSRHSYEHPQGQHTSTSNQEAQSVDTAVNAVPIKNDTEDGTAVTPPAEAATSEASVAGASLSVPSALDPQTPPFVPEASRTPPEAVDTTSDSTAGEGDVPSKQSDPHPLQTTTPWMPYQTTPPDDSIRSPIQQPLHNHGHPAPLFYDPTAPYNHPSVNPAVYYGYGLSNSLSFYPQSSQSYTSASPAQSSYEGYAIANTPRASQPQPNAHSHRHAPSTSTPFSNPLVHPTYEPQAQYAPNIPQFGNHLPITPSATPSNSESHKQAPSPTDNTTHDTSSDQPGALDGRGQADVLQKVSQEYKEWCDRTVDTLKDEVEPSVCSDTLLNHLIENFNNPAFADCELYISHVSHRFEPAVVSLHSLLIAQNVVLHELVQGAEIREDGKKQILLVVKDQYAAPAALRTAIQVCYGKRPSQYTGYPGDPASEPATSKVWMDNALALAAAGHLLGMTGVAHRGEQIASVILDWHNIQQALSFALDTNVQRAWGSSTVSSTFPCNASELLLSCLYFVVRNISEDTNLDLAAKPLPSINRLPAVLDSQAQSSRSRLSRIQFGDLRLETQDPPTEHDVLVSRILLSLPFVHFKFILDRLPVEINKKIARPIVEERERRRLRALDAQTNTTSAITEETPALVQAERIVQRDEEGGSRLGVEEVKV